MREKMKLILNGESVDLAAKIKADDKLKVKLNA
jgi:hypothetical protein